MFVIANNLIGRTGIEHGQCIDASKECLDFFSPEPTLTPLMQPLHALLQGFLDGLG